ncbi:MAG: outer membrane beta-barrel protein [Smithella sp.]|mgnify:FL=1|jgi:hypothetical protein|nr:outer membrane beta-barrel protein [Smithella sp.]
MIKLRRFFYVIAATVSVCMSPVAYGADILSQIHPYITVSEEYSDNLHLTKNDKKEDFMTTIRPGIRFSNMDAQSGVELDASAGYIFHARYENLDYLTANVDLNARYLTTSHFNFYIRNSFIRSDDPREREFFSTTPDNRYVLSRETERRIYIRNIVEPMVEYQFGPESSVGLRYRNNYYRDKDTHIGGVLIDNDSVENYINPFLTYWVTRQHGFSVDYGYTDGHFHAQPDLKGHRVGASYMLRFTPRAIASVGGAYTSQLFSDKILNYDIYDAFLSLSYEFSPTLTASAEAGYYWMTPRHGENQDGVTFRADITQLDGRTTYRAGIQGGYTQDYFTSQNLGFRKYYRATGSVTHELIRTLSVGILGSIEYAESDNAPPEPKEKDIIWMAGANIAYTPFQWLRIAFDYRYQQQSANDYYDLNEYKEHRAILSLTATY